LKKILDKIVCSDPKHIIEERRKSLELISHRASELESESKKIIGKLDKGVQTILSGMNVCLFEELLKNSDYHDMNLIRDLKRGFPMVGEIFGTSKWKKEEVPAKISRNELDKIAEDVKKAVLSSIKPSDHDFELFKKCEEEIELGFASKIYKNIHELEAEIGEKWLPAVRFAHLSERPVVDENGNIFLSSQIKRFF